MQKLEKYGLDFETIKKYQVLCLPENIETASIEGKPIHVVFSYDEATDTGYVVTAYIPDANIWLNGFKTRRTR